MSTENKTEEAVEELPVQEEFVMDDLYQPGTSEELYELADHPGSKTPPIDEQTMRNAHTGQYETTMFEMWKKYLQGAIAEAEGPLTIPNADFILRQWPWFKYYDIPQYRIIRAQVFKEAVGVLESCYPSPEEILFTENEDDWKLHGDAYIEVIVGWTRLVNRWTAKWMDIPLNKGAKSIYHGAISDCAATLINPRNGMVEQLRALANFYISPEQGEMIAVRGSMESDDE